MCDEEWTLPIKRTTFTRRRKAVANVVQPSTSSHVVTAAGLQIRALRIKLGLTVQELAAQANVSTAMVSKIENGYVEASVGCLENLARALNVPITELFAQLYEEHDCTYARAADAPKEVIIPGYQSQRLGHTVLGRLRAEFNLITLTERVINFDLLGRTGANFIYMLAGHVLFRCGSQTFLLAQGDSLLLNLTDLHGPEEIIAPPVAFISVCAFLLG